MVWGVEFERRYEVRRESSRGHWLVVDTRDDTVVRSFGLRTNWIDGRQGKPYGPKGAADEIAARLNEQQSDD